MKLSILLFALACACPVALSHKRYILVPVSALKNGQLDSKSGQYEFDINPLQVVTGNGVQGTGTGTGRAGGGSSSRVSTSVRRAGSTRGSSREATTRSRSVAVTTSGSSSHRRNSLTPRRNVNYITPAHGVTNLPGGRGTYGIVRYINTLSPSYTSGYVQSVYQPHTRSVTPYQPGFQRSAYLLDAGIRQRMLNAGYVMLPQYQTNSYNQAYRINTLAGNAQRMPYAKVHRA